jgi:hypothetical protein
MTYLVPSWPSAGTLFELFGRISLTSSRLRLHGRWNIFATRMSMFEL